jgi:hypothetical protein
LHLIEERTIALGDTPSLERLAKPEEVTGRAARFDFVLQDAFFKRGNALRRALSIAAHRGSNYGART